MGNILRTIQFKRNGVPAISAEEAKQRILSLDSTLANGEFILGSYMDTKSVNGTIANVLGIKAQDKIFFVDNQTILNKLGIKDDGTEDPNAAEGSFVKQIADIIDSIDDADGLIDAIIEAAGLNADGTYTADPNAKFISGATSLKDADTKLSDEIKAVEDFIGMGEDVSGKSLVEKIDEISGKSITTVENTNTVTLTKEETIDGTQKVKADVNVSAVEGNIILVKNDGIYTEVDYNAATNALIVNGVEKTLNAGSIIDSISYDEETEELVIVYHTSSSAEPIEVRVPLAELIEEYDFIAKDDAHNVGFTITRNVSGKTTVQADVNLIDCGEY